MVLVIAMSGAFAAPLVVSTGTVTDVEATLKATIGGGFFRHGFVNPADSSEFNSSLEIEDAFVSNPTFTYGYETNTSTAFGIYMDVSDFIHDTTSGVAIKIEEVEIGGSPASNVNGVYTLALSSAAGLSENVVIEIIPMKNISTDTDDHLGDTILSTETTKFVNEEATPGGYTSTVTVSVATIS